jgi:hypothetical protein
VPLGDSGGGETEEPGRFVYLRNNATTSGSGSGGDNGSDKAPPVVGDGGTGGMWWLAAVTREGSVGVASGSSGGEGGPSDAQVAAACRWRCDAVPSPQWTWPASSPRERARGGGAGAAAGTSGLSADGRVAALSAAEVRQFVEWGYVVCRQAAPKQPCEEALAYVNGKLGRAGEGGGRRLTPVRTAL